MKTLDQQMEEIRQEKDPRSRLNAIVKPKDMGIKQMSDSIYKGTKKALKKLYKNGVTAEEFVNEVCDYSKPKKKTAEKYGVTEHFISNTRVKPEQFVFNYNRVNKI